MSSTQIRAVDFHLELFTLKNHCQENVILFKCYTCNESLVRQRRIYARYIFKWSVESQYFLINWSWHYWLHSLLVFGEGGILPSSYQAVLQLTTKLLILSQRQHLLLQTNDSSNNPLIWNYFNSTNPIHLQ